MSHESVWLGHVDHIITAEFIYPGGGVYHRYQLSRYQVPLKLKLVLVPWDTKSREGDHEGEGEDEVAAFSAKRWNRRSRGAYRVCDPLS